MRTIFKQDVTLIAGYGGQHFQHGWLRLLEPFRKQRQAKTTVEKSISAALKLSRLHDDPIFTEMRKCFCFDFASKIGSFSHLIQYPLIHESQSMEPSCNQQIETVTCVFEQEGFAELAQRILPTSTQRQESEAEHFF